MSIANTTTRTVAGRFTLWMVLISIAVTGVLSYTVWRFTNDRAEAEARVVFEFRVSQIESTIRERMQNHEQALISMSMLFTSDTSVDSGRWVNHFKMLRIEEKFPGFQGIGYAPRITQTERVRLESQQRATGVENYTIRPEGEREIYTPVVYLAPVIERHVKALGQDPYHEPMRRAAMDAARDQGRAVITPKVVLSQEQKNDMQPGVLMYLPVYRRGAEAATEQQRRAAIQGYVFSTFRMHNLANSMLGKSSDMRIEIFDGKSQRAADQLYDGAPAPGADARVPLFSSISSVPVYGREWGLRVSSLPEFESKIDRSAAIIATISTAAICILAFAIIWSLATLRRRATQLAQRMTDELRQSRERLSLALDGSELALFDWDIASGSVRLSRRWNAMLGGEAVPVTTSISELEKITHPDDFKLLQQRLYNVLKREIPTYEIEHRVRFHDGSWRWILSRGKVVGRNEKNRALRLVGTNADIHERKETERLKSEFIATVSHELRTPLTGILGALGLMRAGVADDASGKLRPLADIAHRNGERLAKLVNDMLDIQNLESGQMTFDSQPVAATELLTRAITSGAALTEKYGVKFELAQADAALAVRADSERTLQVLMNLLSNAAKFSPKGATVMLRASANGKSVRISVTDSGPGVPEQFRERMFGKFAQADSSSTRQTEGSGLGLAVSRLIVEKMGGSIGYESAPEQGAVFYFDLPATV
jgi:PAS domain S-box-containing protein